MKILLDTNLLVPAGLYPDGVCAKAYNKAVKLPYYCIVCNYSLQEMFKTFDKKFPNKIKEMQAFLLSICLNTELIRTPLEKESISDEKLIRDVKDRPILRAAVVANVDIIVTGDNDFLESGLTKPKIMSPAEFVNFIDSKPNKI